MKNPKDRITAAFLLLIIIFTFYSVVVFSSNEPTLSAKASALYEPSTNKFIYEKNANTRLPMASTTKIMTALIAIEQTPAIDKSIRIADEAVGIEGSSLYLKRGEIISMYDLIAALMLRSANDAAVAIAYAVAGGIAEFSDLMNEKVLELGLKDTHFENPHGLDDKNHYTTAKDLAIISAEAMKNDIFKEIVSSKTKKITNSDNETRLVTNHNKLLSLYDGAIGVKTGFTKRCGRCLVGACERDGLSFITVTIDAPDDWNDHISLFNYGYSKLVLRKVAQIGEFSYKIPVIGGECEYITVSNTDEFSIVTEKTCSDIKTHVKLIRYTTAPVNQGDIMRKVIFTLNDNVIGEIDLLAQNDSKPLKHKFSIL